ncbi:MAG: hypothetical protein HFJ08_13770 [Lachnospiraceae bacterium]|jgi:HD-GYP domain|nr:hypothetical protein [Lachnospiraceae bacterium]
MQPYQEEYISNLKDIHILTARKRLAGCSFATYQEALAQDRQQVKEKIERNMYLLREELFPLLDNLLDANAEQLEELYSFANELLSGRNELDGGLFCQIHKALLSRARLSKDRNTIIRELYWLGMGLHNMCGKMVGLDYAKSEKYMSQMRLCFAEAAAYLKYFDEIDDNETRGYIFRSRANTSLGQFKSASEKIRRVRQTLQILQDEGYQEKAPELPWERYIYMTHQQMSSSISYSRENDMTSQDVADIMESAHIVYERQIADAKERNATLPVKSAFSCFATEYYCGLSVLEELLANMETLMDAADSTDFSSESMYGIISLPAFYSQYLREYPEYLAGREEYLEGLYQRVLDYVDIFPEAGKNEQIFYFLRQLSTAFIEIQHGITYGMFQQKIMIRFAPDIYVHSWVVGAAASALCAVIMEEEPTFFDDIAHIRAILDPEKKQQYVRTYAMECGLFHDVGKINFMSLYSQTARQWFAQEYEIAHLHTVVGEARLSDYESTCHYAAAALGHHSWYDGSQGYPETYQRLECPYRQIVDVIGLVDWFDNVMQIDWLYGCVKKTFDEAVQEAISLEGRRFSPLLTAWLRDKAVAQKFKEAFANGRLEAYQKLYQANVKE